MALSNIIAGLQVFEKYNGTMSAYHEEIKAGQPREITLTEEDVKILRESNWHPDWSFAWDAHWDDPDEEAPMELLQRCDCWYTFV